MANQIEKYCEYMHKEAWNPVTTSIGFMRGGRELTSEVMTGLLGMAALAGAGTGYTVSQLTSPAKADIKNEQKAYLADKLKRAIAERQRKLTIQEDQAVNKEQTALPPVKTLRI